MTDTEARNQLRAVNADGMPWEEIAHRVNLQAGERRVITPETLRRFVVEERKMRDASTYWVERWLLARQAAAATSAGPA